MLKQQKQKENWVVCVRVCVHVGIYMHLKEKC